MTARLQQLAMNLWLQICSGNGSYVILQVISTSQLPDVWEANKKVPRWSEHVLILLPHSPFVHFLTIRWQTSKFRMVKAMFSRYYFLFERNFYRTGPLRTEIADKRTRNPMYGDLRFSSKYCEFSGERSTTFTKPLFELTLAFRTIHFAPVGVRLQSLDNISWSAEWFSSFWWVLLKRTSCLNFTFPLRF